MQRGGHFGRAGFNGFALRGRVSDIDGRRGERSLSPASALFLLTAGTYGAGGGQADTAGSVGNGVPSYIRRKRPRRRGLTNRLYCP